MRLSCVKHEVPFGMKIGARMAPLIMKLPIPDIAFALEHRKALWGQHVNRWLQRVLRGPSDDWSVGERELFAALTAERHRCPF